MPEPEGTTHGSTLPNGGGPEELPWRRSASRTSRTSSTTSCESLAENEHRSLAQQVIHLLGEAVEEQEPRSLLELKGLGKELLTRIDPARHVEEERAAWD